MHGDGGSVKGGNRGDRKQAAAMEQGQGKKRTEQRRKREWNPDVRARDGMERIQIEFTYIYIYIS